MDIFEDGVVNQLDLVDQRTREQEKELERLTESLQQVIVELELMRENAKTDLTSLKTQVQELKEKPTTFTLLDSDAEHAKELAKTFDDTDYDQDNPAQSYIFLLKKNFSFVEKILQDEIRFSTYRCLCKKHQEKVLSGVQALNHYVNLCEKDEAQTRWALKDETQQVQDLKVENFKLKAQINESKALQDKAALMLQPLQEDNERLKEENSRLKRTTENAQADYRKLKRQCRDMLSPLRKSTQEFDLLAQEDE